MSGSARPPLTSLTRLAPASSAAAATSARMVSTLTGTPSLASPVITGMTRRNSSSADIRWAPGRVDSPPTSTMSAPCAVSCRPRPIAASAPNHSPPSENESGVTFTTPMTRHRPGSGSPGGPGPRRMPAGRAAPGRPPAGVPLVTLVTLCAEGDIDTGRLSRRPGQFPGSGSAVTAQWVRQPGEPHPADDPAADPAYLHCGPDQERLGFQRGESHPRRIPGPGEHEEPRYPQRAELGVELVEGLDLEPPGREQQDATPGTQHRPGADPLAAGQRGAEHREVQRHPLDAEFLCRLDRLHDEEVVDARLCGPLPPHQVERESVRPPRHEMQQAAQHPVLRGRGDDAVPVARAADPAQGH